MSEFITVYSIPLILWTAAAYKLYPHVRRKRRPSASQLELVITLACLGLGAFLLVPPIYPWVGDATGILNLARLLANGLGLVACFTGQSLFIRLTESEGRAQYIIRLYALALGVWLTLLVAFFAAASASMNESALDFTQHFADIPFILEYRIVFMSGFGISAGNISRLAWRYGKIAAANPSLQLGLLLVTFGGIVGVVYALQDIGYLVGLRAKLFHPSHDSLVVAQLLVFVSATSFTIGATLPEWGKWAHVPALYRWLSRYRSLRRLYPLWRALYEATPEIALTKPGSRLQDSLDVRDLGFRLYRRVVEIRDGALTLRQYRSTWSEGVARDLYEQGRASAEETPLVVEAACLAAAIKLKRLNRRSAQVPSDVLPLDQGGADLASEVLVLEKIAHHFARSAVVPATLSQLATAVANGSLACSPEGPTSGA